MLMFFLLFQPSQKSEIRSTLNLFGNPEILFDPAKGGKLEPRVNVLFGCQHQTAQHEDALHHGHLGSTPLCQSKIQARARGGRGCKN